MNTYKILIRGFEYRLDAVDAEAALYTAEAIWPKERIDVWALGCGD